jgi:predicted permease
MMLTDSFGMALRRVVRRPAIAIATILILGAGIGLTTSLFAILDAVLWQPVPVSEPQRLLWIETLASGEADGSSPGLLFAWRDRARTVTSIAGIRAGNATIDDEEGIDRVPGAYVSASYFEALGLSPARGRVFTNTSDRPGADPVVVVSHRLWQRRYRADDGIVGRTIAFNGRPRTIVGVMPPALDVVAEDADWWAPLALPESQRGNVGPSYLDVIGRLAPGESVERARAELAALASATGAKADDGSVRGVRLTSFGDHLTASHRTTLFLLFGAVVILFVIACANVANLQLADGLHRRSEMAVRASLGATRAQLVAQMAFEALIVSACASGIGLVVAQWSLDGLVAMVPADIPRLALVQIDPRTAFAAAAAGLFSAVSAGVIPAIAGSRVDVIDVLRARGRAFTGGGARLRRAFVVVQVALTMGLMTAGALLLRSTYELQRAPRGYDARGVLTAAFTLPAPAFPDGAAQAAAFEQIAMVAGNVPGVSNAAIATRVPLAGSGAGSDLVRMDESFDAGGDRQVRIRLVSPNYFATMKTPIVAGRDFAGSDSRQGRKVVIVNETLARRLAGSAALVGSSVKFALAELNDGGRTTPWEVVGIAADTRDQGPRLAPAPEVFVPLAQSPSEVLGWMGGQALLAVQGRGDVSALTPQLRSAITGTGMKIPLYDVRTMDQRLAAHFATERVASRLLTFLACAGLVLSAFGMFAVLSHLVRRQRREIALMLALGATPFAMVIRVVREGLAMSALGLAIGIAGSLGLSEAFRSLLFGVSTTDPITLLSVGAVVVAVTIASAWLPARAVASLDPATVLRED